MLPFYKTVISWPDRPANNPPEITLELFERPCSFTQRMPDNQAETDCLSLIFEKKKQNNFISSVNNQ